MIWPWSVTRRHIEWLEAEVHLLRQQVFQGYRPPRAVEKQKPDPPPASLVELCSLFEQAGPKLLAEAQQEHARRGTSYEVIEQRIRDHIRHHANGNEAL